MGKLKLVINNATGAPEIPQALLEYQRFVEQAFLPPAEVFRALKIGSAPVVRDELGRRVNPRSLKGMYLSQSGLCCYCCEPMTLPNPRKATKANEAQVVSVTMQPTDVTRDHLYAKSDGNPGKMFNLAAACRLCNEQKGDMPLITFMLARLNNNVTEAYRAYKATKRAASLRQA